MQVCSLVVVTLLHVFGWVQGFSLSEYRLEKKMYGLVFGGDVQLAAANSTAGSVTFSLY